MSRLVIARPNLGTPLILAPNELERFEITIACEKHPWNESEKKVIYTDTKTVKSNLKAYPPSIYWGNFIIPLKTYRVHSYFRHPSYKANYSAVRHAQTSAQQQYLNGFRYEMKAEVGITKQDIKKLKKKFGWPTLLNIGWQRHGKMNSHALYVHETMKNSKDLTILHITDTHIARRNDIIPELLCQVRNKKECKVIEEKYVNFNDHLRVFIKKANERVSKGENVIVVLTGDITDYYFDGYWNGWYLCGQHGKAKDRRKDATGSTWGYSNIEKFREIILGSQNEKGGGLRCPIFTVLGNHEYYANEILLNFLIGSSAADLLPYTKGIREREEYSSFFKDMTQEEKEYYAREYDFWAFPRIKGKNHWWIGRSGPTGPMYYNCPDSLSIRNTFKEIIRKKGNLGSDELNYLKAWRASLVDFAADKCFWLIKPKSWILSQYLRTVNYDLDFEFRLGNHHFLCLNTGYDLYPSKNELKNPTKKHYRDLTEGGPHSRGITSEHLRMVKKALKGNGEKMIFILTHAPLIGMEKAATEGIECIYENTLKKYTSEIFKKAHNWLYAQCQGLFKFDFNKVASDAGYFVPSVKPLENPNMPPVKPKIPWKNGMFKWGGRYCLSFFGADGKVLELMNTIADITSKITNKPIIVLSGHTHKVHEFRIKKHPPINSRLYYYFIDDYATRYFPPTEKVLALILRQALLRNLSPLLLTSDALKNKEPQYREIIIKNQSIASLKMIHLADIEATANYTPGRQTIALRTHNGKYVCAEGGGAKDLIADRDWAREWETFDLVKLEKNNVALMACNRKFVRVRGGGKLRADQHRIKDSETFLMVKKGKNKIALRAKNGNYICAEGGGGREVLANRKKIGVWETFTLVDLK